MRNQVRSSRGITLFEVALMLTTTTALVAALMPTLSTALRHAETVVATSAMTSIQTQVLAALGDMNYQAFTVDGVRNGTAVEILVSDGDIPREVSATGSVEWQRAVDNGTGLVDFLERHLVTNDPRGSAINAYPVAGPPPNFWRGTYLDSPINPDPWGNRYAVNAEFFNGGNEDVVVLSSGPDEEIDTVYSQNGLVAGDDDLVVLVAP